MNTIETPALETLFDQMMDGVYLIDPVTSNILWVNRAGYTHLNMKKEEVLHQSVLSLQNDVVGTEQWQSIAEVIRQTKKFTFVGHHTRKDGPDFPVEVNTSCFEIDGNEYFLSISRDISARRAQEAQGMGREQQVWFALNECSDGLWDWNRADETVYFSPSLKRMLGYGPNEMPPVIGTWKDNVHPDDLPHVFQALNEHMEGRRERYEAVYRLRNRNGHYLWVHDLGSISERDCERNPIRITGIVKDITDYKIQEERLLAQAAYDSLTGLRNRREYTHLVEKLLEFAQRNSQPMSIALFDLDFFKTINDRYGHIAGDAVLKEVAQFMGDNLRKSDYLFRWGGEEFIIIGPNTTTKAMYDLAEKLRTKLADLVISYGDHEISVTSSFGIANYPEHGEKEAELMLKADGALYRAKSKGRNCVIIAE